MPRTPALAIVLALTLMTPLVYAGAPGSDASSVDAVLVTDGVPNPIANGTMDDRRVALAELLVRLAQNGTLPVPSNASLQVGMGDLDPWVDASGDLMTGNLVMGPNSIILGGTPLVSPAPGLLQFAGADVCLDTGNCPTASGDITAVLAGFGLTGGATTGDASVAVDTSLIQRRVLGSCASDEVVRAINADGSVVCDPDDDTDTNTDVLASLSCSEGQLPKRIAGSWGCGDDIDTDTDTTYSGADFALSDQSCVAGELVLGVSATGTIICAVDQDTATTSVPWSAVTDKPAGFADDVDHDTLATLVCASGQVAKHDGAGWACGDDIDTDTDTDTTYSGADFALSDQSCVAGELVLGVSATGTIVCSADQDTDTDTLGALSCAGGEVAKWDGSTWACAVDIDTDTDTTYDGTDFALSGQSCGPGDVAIAIDATGSVTCAPDQDTDTDTLGSLVCADGELPKYDATGSSWVCGQDIDTDTDTDTTYSGADFALSGQSCVAGELVLGVSATGTIVCEVDQDTDTDTDTLASLSCADGELPKYDSGTSSWVCGQDIDTDTDTTYTAGPGLTRSGTEFALLSCPAGQVLKAASSPTGWACGDDLDTQATSLPWSSITDKPAGFTDDVDNDVLAGLACSDGEVAKIASGAWACGQDIDTDTDTDTLADLTCADGEVAKYDTAMSQWGCAVDTDTDTDTTYSGADFALSGQSCPAGQLVQAIDASGAVQCEVDQDTDTDTDTLTSLDCADGEVAKYDAFLPGWACDVDQDTDTDTQYMAGDGLTLAGTTFSVSPCADGQVLKFDAVSASWTCATDADTHTTSLPWSSITDKPAGFADGVDDVGITSETDPTVNALAKASLACAAGQIAKSDGAAWTCGEDVDTDTDTTYSGADFALSSQGCAGTDVVVGIDGGGALDCGPAAAGAWLIGGNAGTTPGTDFIGTTDAQAFEVHVQGSRALRVEPGTSANVIAGSPENRVTAGTVGAAILGGGTSGGGNTVTGNYGLVGAGRNNSARGTDALVAGGISNNATGPGAAVVGGIRNVASGGRAFVGTGFNNEASGAYAAVTGGFENAASGAYSAVPGGIRNQAAGLYTLAAGHEAHANHRGSFVWSDDGSAPFASTADNQFLIEAAGGVGIGTNAPQEALHVAGAGKFAGNLDVDGDRISLGTAEYLEDAGPNRISTGINDLWTDRSLRTNGSMYMRTGAGATTDADQYIYFLDGGSFSEAIYWDDSSDLFSVTDTLLADDVRSRGSVFVNADGPEGSSSLFFFEGGSIGGERLTWCDTCDSGAGYFVLSDKLWVGGDLTVTGAKNFVAPDPVVPSQAIYYSALEGPEAGIYYRGSGQLADGVARIDFPPEFERVLSGAEPVTVSVTPTGPGAPVYVAEKGTDHVVVKEFGDAGTSTPFDFVVYGVRAGYEDYEVFRPNEFALTVPSPGIETIEHTIDPPELPSEEVPSEP